LSVSVKVASSGSLSGTKLRVELVHSVRDLLCGAAVLVDGSISDWSAPRGVLGAQVAGDLSHDGGVEAVRVLRVGLAGQALVHGVAGIRSVSAGGLVGRAGGGSSVVRFCGRGSRASESGVELGLERLVITRDESKVGLDVAGGIDDLLGFVEGLEVKVVDIMVVQPADGTLQVSLCVGRAGDGLSGVAASRWPADLSEPDFLLGSLVLDVGDVGGQTRYGVLNGGTGPVGEGVDHDDIDDGDDLWGGQDVHVSDGDTVSSEGITDGLGLLNGLDDDSRVETGRLVDGVTVEIFRTYGDTCDVAPAVDLNELDELGLLPTPPISGRGLHAEEDFESGDVGGSEDVVTSIASDSGVDLDRVGES